MRSVNQDIILEIYIAVLFYLSPLYEQHVSEAFISKAQYIKPTGVDEKMWPQGHITTSHKATLLLEFLE